MYKLVAKNFEKNKGEHKLNLELYDGDKLIKEKVYTCSFNQFRNKLKQRLVSAAMIELEKESLENFDSDYSSTDFMDDNRIEVKQNYENPYN